MSKENVNNGLVEEVEPSSSAFNHNTYATIKTFSASLVDVALIASNGTQIRYLVEQGATKNKFYYVSLSLLIISLIAQVAFAILCGVVGMENINFGPGQKKATPVIKAILGISILVTVTNILIASFGTGSDG